MASGHATLSANVRRPGLATIISKFVTTSFGMSPNLGLQVYEQYLLLLDRKCATLGYLERQVKTLPRDPILAAEPTEVPARHRGCALNLLSVIAVLGGKISESPAVIGHSIFIEQCRDV